MTKKKAILTITDDLSGLFTEKDEAQEAPTKAPTAAKSTKTKTASRSKGLQTVSLSKKL
nr:hypothetical protein [Caldalkalibacillus salinus]